MSPLAVIPEGLPRAWPPAPRCSENILCLTSVPWRGDLGRGVRCARHDYLRRKCLWILWATNNRLEVSCKVLCLWLVNYHIWTNMWRAYCYSGSHFWHFKDVWGHLFSAKIYNSAKATQAHSGMSLPPAHKGPIILQTSPAYSPAKTHFAKGGKTIKLQILLNVSGAIKNVYYSTGILCWYLPKAQHTWQIHYLISC